MQLLINTVLNGWSKMIYYTMTHQILALIQQPAPISNCFFRIKKHKLEELVADVNSEIKIPGTVLNKIF